MIVFVSFIELNTLSVPRANKVFDLVNLYSSLVKIFYGISLVIIISVYGNNYHGNTGFCIIRIDYSAGFTGVKYDLRKYCFTNRVRVVSM